MQGLNVGGGFVPLLELTLAKKALRVQGVPLPALPAECTIVQQPVPLW